MSCRQDIPAFVELDCDVELGRINAIAFVTEEKAALADADNSLWSNPTFYTDEDYTGDVLIHQKVSGSYAGADTEISGKGNQQSRVAGKNHTVTVRIESVKGNNSYFDKLTLSDNYRLVFITDDYDLLLVSTTNCNLSGNMILEDNLESIVEWELTAKWSDIRLPESFDVPTGIFES